MDEEKNLEQEINVANEVVATIAGMAVSKLMVLLKWQVVLQKV